MRTLLLVFFFLFIASIVSAEPKPQADNKDFCNGYLDLSAKLQCSSSNYLTQFGYRYCRTFEEQQMYFTPHGQKVLEGLRVCLLSSLQKSVNSCDAVESVAYPSHVDCYVKEGFCEMDPTDQMQILWIVRAEISNPEFQSTSAKVAQACAAVGTAAPSR